MRSASNYRVNKSRPSKVDKLKSSYRDTRNYRVSKTEEKSNHYEGLGGMNEVCYYDILWGFHQNKKVELLF